MTDTVTIKKVLIVGEVLHSDSGALTVRLEDGFAGAQVIVAAEKALPGEQLGAMMTDAVDLIARSEKAEANVARLRVLLEEKGPPFNMWAGILDGKWEEIRALESALARSQEALRYMGDLVQKSEQAHEATRICCGVPPRFGHRNTCVVGAALAPQEQKPCCKGWGNGHWLSPSNECHGLSSSPGDRWVSLEASRPSSESGTGLLRPGREEPASVTRNPSACLPSASDSAFVPSEAAKECDACGGVTKDGDCAKHFPERCECPPCQDCVQVLWRLAGEKPAAPAAFCPKCGARIPGIVGEGRCPDCEKYAEKPRQKLCSCGPRPERGGHWADCDFAIEKNAPEGPQGPAD